MEQECLSLVLRFSYSYCVAIGRFQGNDEMHCDFPSRGVVTLYP